MTSLSEYMRAEWPDKTEPAAFYIPGAESWDNAGSHSRKMRWLLDAGLRNFRPLGRSDEPDEVLSPQELEESGLDLATND